MSELTPGPWTVERIPDQKYPDIARYNIYGVNPDAGKECVSYSGERFAVAMGLDNEADANLITAAPELYAALDGIMRTGEITNGVWRTSLTVNSPILADVRAVLARAKANPAPAEETPDGLIIIDDPYTGEPSEEQKQRTAEFAEHVKQYRPGAPAEETEGEG